MNVRINGEDKSLADGMTIENLIEELELADKRLAVELNQDIVPRSEFDTTTLSEGDTIEIVHAIGGGQQVE